MRTLAAHPLGTGLWQVETIPFSPRCSATAAYSSGSPTACLHNGVCMCESMNSVVISNPAYQRFFNPYPHSLPPDTGRIAPVTKDAAGEARNTATEAISSGLAV